MSILLGLGTLALSTYFLRIAFHNLRMFNRSPAPSAWGVAGTIRIPRFAEFAFALREVSERQGVPSHVVDRALSSAQNRVGQFSAPSELSRAVFEALVEESGVPGPMARELVDRTETQLTHP
jgi:hypothetical protein